MDTPDLGVPSGPPASRRFLRAERMRRPSEFQRAYRNGRRARSVRLTVCAVGNAFPQARIGLSVSSSIGNAAVRNRWKRLLREAFRLEKARFPRAVDLVLIPEGKGPPPPLADLRRDLPALAARAAEALAGAPKRPPPRGPRRRGR